MQEPWWLFEHTLIHKSKIYLDWNVNEVLFTLHFHLLMICQNNSYNLLYLILIFLNCLENNVKYKKLRLYEFYLVVLFKGSILELLSLPENWISSNTPSFYIWQIIRSVVSVSSRMRNRHASFVELWRISGCAWYVAF